MVTTMLPELADGLDTSLATAASSLTTYLVPFAGMMLVSGTLAEHWGRARTIRLAYVGYAAASILCVLAQTAPLFLAARALQGTANAFTTPLLVAAITDLVPRERLGRSLGVFGGMQAAGQAFAPLVGGLAAAVDYRWAFVAAAAAAALLATMPPSGPPHAPLATGSRWRSLATPQLALACAVAFGLYLSTTGINVLVALLAHDRFGLGPDQRGLVVATFGLAGLLAAPQLGRVSDRVGVMRFGAVASVLFAMVIAFAGVAPHVAVLVAVMALCGAASTAGRLSSTTLAVTSAPANRAGATSMALAWQFVGSALAPIVVLPLYGRTVEAAFAVAAVGAAGAAVLLTTTARLRGRAELAQR